MNSRRNASQIIYCMFVRLDVNKAMANEWMLAEINYDGNITVGWTEILKVHCTLNVRTHTHTHTHTETGETVPVRFAEVHNDGHIVESTCRPAASAGE